MKPYPLPRSALMVATAGMLVTAASQAGQTFTHRLTATQFDYDNNGVIDATTMLTYDASGRVTDTVYIYTGDGVTDLFVTQDDDAAREDSALAYNGDDLLSELATVRALMDGGTETFDTLYTLVSGQLTRVDSESTLSGGINATYTTLNYSASVLAEIVERQIADDTEIYRQSYQYGGDGLPSVVTFDSPGTEFMTGMTWRGDGQIEGLTTAITFKSSSNPDGGTGTATFTYDTRGLLQSETWTFTDFVGSIFAEYQGVRYRKTYSYDADDLLIREETDIGNDGSVEAVETLAWELGACVPVFLFAVNGRPNFVVAEERPYIPGTGATYAGNCGPSFTSDEVTAAEPQSVPAVAVLVQPAVMALLGVIGVGAWRLRRGVVR